MSLWNSKPLVRWIVPAAAALAVIGGGAALGALTAVAEPRLGARSAAQLLVDLQTARLDGLSGTVVQRADLGLPALPGLGGQGSSDLSSLVSGTHTLRVWYAGPDQARVALLGTLGETDVIRNGRDLWIWESRANRATHRTLPTSDKADVRLSLAPTNLPFTPQQLADAALAALEPSTEVSTARTERIAGRDAYELVLAPRDKASLVGSVRLAIDADEHVPLRVRVFAKDGGDPAIEVAFTEVSFARPDPEQFAFNPPPGATVTEEGTGGGARRHDDGAKPFAGPPAVAVVGSGWTSVLVTRLPEQKAPADKPADAGRWEGAGPADLIRILEALPTVSGTWGSGRVLTSRLFSVLLTDDGRILVGAVTPDRLYQATADPAAKLGT